MAVQLKQATFRNSNIAVCRVLLVVTQLALAHTSASVLPSNFDDAQALLPAAGTQALRINSFKPQLYQQLVQSTTSDTSTAQRTQTEASVPTSTSGASEQDTPDSLTEFLENNFLRTDFTFGGIATTNKPTLVESYEQQEEISSLNSLVHSAFRQQKPGSGKNGKHNSANYQQRVDDWWNKLASSKTKNTKRLNKEPPSVNSSQEGKQQQSIYREQPLSQNSILTMRNQLYAIRNKYRLLMSSSVSQLQQLDQKLVDSYKLCLKRKMPLYAGMLYRTRDYVVRMAGEVRQERQVLEAIAKQVQKVLRQRTANRTLVREYNRVNLAPLTSTEPSASSSQFAHQFQPSDAPTRINSQDQKSMLEFDLKQEQTGNGGKERRDSSYNDRSKEQNLMNLAEISSLEADTTASAAAVTYTPTLKSNKRRSHKTQQKRHESALTQSLNQQRQPATEIFGSGGIKEKQQQPPPQQNRCNIENILECHSTTSKPKQRYSVHINEVNLRKELAKTQALIDRINKSTKEISDVVDDIIYLFKLTTDSSVRKNIASPTDKARNKFDKTSRNHFGPSPTQVQQEITNVNTIQMLMDQRKAKKMLKSPIKVFLERYGKLKLGYLDSIYTPLSNSMVVENPNNLISSSGRISSTNSSEISNVNNFPELKPLFDAATLKELSDQELGFDFASEAAR